MLKNSELVEQISDFVMGDLNDLQINYPNGIPKFIVYSYSLYYIFTVYSTNRKNRCNTRLFMNNETYKLVVKL